MLKKKLLSATMSSLLLLGSCIVSSADSTQAGQNSAAPAEKQTVSRISGKNRFETSVEASKMVNSKTLIIADGRQFADSLSAVNVAMSTGGKFILTDRYTDITKIFSPSEINKVYIVGGSVSKYVQDRAKSLDSNTTYLIGTDRYDTNQKTLDQFNITSVGVADGRNFPDALSASGLLVNKKIGLKLVDGSKPYGTLKETVVYTFGGKNTVFQDGGKRLAGDNRFLTNIAINSEIGTKSAVAVASGLNFPDALSSINAVIAHGASIALANNPSKSEINYFFKNASQVYIFGGNSSIGQSTVNDMLYNPDVTYQNPGKPDSTGNYSGSINVYDILKYGSETPILSVNSNNKANVKIPDGYKPAKVFPEDKNTIYVVRNNAILFNTQEDVNAAIAKSILMGMKPITFLGDGKESIQVYMTADKLGKLYFPDYAKVYAASLGLGATGSMHSNGTVPGIKTYYKPDFTYYTNNGFFLNAQRIDDMKQTVDKANSVIKGLGINPNTPTKEKVEKISKWIYDNYYYNINQDYVHLLVNRSDAPVVTVFDINELNYQGYAGLTGLLFNAAGIEVQTVRSGDIYWNRYKDNNIWINIDNANTNRRVDNAASQANNEFSIQECLNRGADHEKLDYTNTDLEADQIYALLYKYGYTHLEFKD